MSKQKPTVVKLWRAILNNSTNEKVIIDFAYEADTDKIAVTATDVESSRAITEKYSFDDLANMSQSQLDAVIADLARFVGQGGGCNLWE